MEASEFFDTPARNHQVRREGYHRYIVVMHSDQLFGALTGDGYVHFVTGRDRALRTQGRCSIVRGGALTLARNVERYPVIGSWQAFKDLGTWRDGWDLTAGTKKSPWRFERRGVGAVQKQRFGDWTGETPDGVTFRDRSAISPGYTHYMAMLWETALRERTLTLLSRPRSGALATPETFHALMRAEHA